MRGRERLESVLGMLVIAAIVAAILVGLSWAQARSYSREADELRRRDDAAVTEVVPPEASCSELRLEYAVRYNVWRAAVKKRDVAEDEAQLAVMRALLRRIYDLETNLRCGG